MVAMGPTEELKEMMLDLLITLEDDFKCNHSQEIEGDTVEIFTRDHEKKVVTEFINKSL